MLKDTSAKLLRLHKEQMLVNDYDKRLTAEDDKRLSADDDDKRLSADGDKRGELFQACLPLARHNRGMDITSWTLKRTAPRRWWPVGMSRLG